MQRRAYASPIVLLLVLLAAVSIKCDDDDDNTVKFQYKHKTELKCKLKGPIEFYRVAASANSTEETKLDGDDNIKLEENVLTIKDPRRPDITANYYCKNAETGEKQEFVKKVAPYVSKPDRVSITVTEGGFAEMICRVLYGNEDEKIPVTWKWVRNGTELSSDDRLIIDNSKAGESKLNISKLTMDDKGEYECHLANSYGTHFEKVHLRVKDALAVLWPFIAIVAEVIILSAIILIYEKKCAKKPNREVEENEQSQNLMGGDSNNSDLKKRTAKA